MVPLANQDCVAASSPRFDWPTSTWLKRLLCAAAKSNVSRHVPLNKEACEVLARWQRQTSTTGRVFNARCETVWPR
jgi:hypothetical protein